MVPTPLKDLHVLKYFSSVVTVSEGKVINITEPTLRHCPLACHFSKELKKAAPGNLRSLGAAIQKTIESKIRDFGFFTKDRSFDFPMRVVPYGASEMLAASLRKGFLEAAVVVCDGAGTVITSSPETAQGIGARMNTLIFTSPLKEIQKKLKTAGCHIVSEDNAWIDQAQGVEKAFALGYKKIGVTVMGADTKQLEQIRTFEKKTGMTVVILSVCTSGLSDSRAKSLCRHADLVWTCASGEARHLFGKKARLQISREIPVYALTRRGVEMTFSFLGASAKNLVDPDSQYLVSRKSQGISLGSGRPGYYLRVASLPVESSQSPRLV